MINFKKLSGVIHLWLGLLSGLVIFISLTAASIFVWQEELTNAVHHELVFIKQPGKTVMSLDSLLVSAQQAVQGHTLTRVAIYPDNRRAYMFSNFKQGKKNGFSYNNNVVYNEQVYVDPYTGRVQGVIDNRYDWIWWMYALHVSLFLDYDFGHYLVGTATLILFVMAVTGIILWWPKNKAALKKRLWFHWKKTTRWKRKNYDLHNIGGIYTWIFVLFLASTGLVWTFEWWENGIYRLLGDDPAKLFAEGPKPLDHVSPTSGIYQQIFNDSRQRVQDWKKIEISLLENKTDSAKSLASIIHYRRGSGWDDWDAYSYNSKNAQMYHAFTQQQKTLGEKWRTSNYAIHTGSIYGLPTKLLASFTSLCCAFLPVSGVLIWWGRKKKSKIKIDPLRK